MAVFDAHANLAVSHVAVAPAPPTTGTSLTLTTGHGAARFTAAPPFNVIIAAAGVPPDPSTAEVARVTARTGDVLTLLRAQEGTTARAILVGDVIALSITAKVVTDIEAAVNGAPSLHAPTHSSGGGDPVTVTALAGYPGGTTTFLRADGSFATPATGVPAAHHLTHEPGGSDPLVVDAVAATGSLRTLGTGANQATAGNDGRLTNARTPTAHASTHSSGQSDPVTVTALAGYPGGTANFLRADGTFAAPPTGGIPSAHATTHNTGGSDLITALAGSVITTGTVADARLSANVALEDVANVFTQDQTISKDLPSLYLNNSSLGVDQRKWRKQVGAAGGLFWTAVTDANAQITTALTLLRDGAVAVGTTLIAPGGLSTTPLNATQLTSGTVPDARLSSNVALENVQNIFTIAQTIQAGADTTLYFNDATQPANARLFRLTNGGQSFAIGAMTDAAVLQLQCSMDRNGVWKAPGGLVERGRAAALGEWTNVPNNAADFTASGGGGGTVTVAAHFNRSYTLIGKTCVYALAIQLTLSSTPVIVRIALPSGLVLGTQAGGCLAVTGGIGVVNTPATATAIDIYRDASFATSWAAGTFYFFGTLTFQIQ